MFHYELVFLPGGVWGITHHFLPFSYGFLLQGYFGFIVPEVVNPLYFGLGGHFHHAGASFFAGFALVVLSKFLEIANSNAIGIEGGFLLDEDASIFLKDLYFGFVLAEFKISDGLLDFASFEGVDFRFPLLEDGEWVLFNFFPGLFLSYFDGVVEPRFHSSMEFAVI